MIISDAQHLQAGYPEEGEDLQTINIVGSTKSILSPIVSQEKRYSSAKNRHEENNTCGLLEVGGGGLFAKGVWVVEGQTRRRKLDAKVIRKKLIPQGVKCQQYFSEAKLCTYIERR